MHNCSREQIELRAYQLWQERGRPTDTGEIDWLKAEAELREARPKLSKVAHRFGTIVGSMVASAKTIAKASSREKHPLPL